MSTAARPVSSRTDRLRRALALVKAGKVKEMGGTQYHVASNDDGGHYVDLSESPSCHCGDSCWRTADCKHVIATRLYRADPQLVQSLADMFTEKR